MAPEPEAAGHEVRVVVDFTVDDDTCGLADYATVAIETIGSRTRIILVVQSIAAYIATRISVD